jgi:HD-GYP domain-containing protein (c-di-GMP phosphodiesterase class II)
MTCQTVNRTAKFLGKMGAPRNPPRICEFCDDWNMTFEERLESIAQNLDMLTKIHLDNDREYRERLAALEEARVEQEKARIEHEKARIEHEKAREERDRALAAHAQAVAEFTLEVSRNVTSINRALERLSDIAVDHEHRIKDLEDQ